MTHEHHDHEHHHEHGHDHCHEHDHHHDHDHHHECGCGCGHHHHHHDEHCSCGGEPILTIRSYSGLSGDMILCGLLRMLELDQAEIDRTLESIHGELKATLKLEKKEIRHISGWHCHIDLPHQHEHRTLKDILDIIRASGMSIEGKRRAEKTFTLLAQAEGEVHGVPFIDVHFHEVGALDSILDICLACELFARLAPETFVVSPLPIADGVIHCAHGQIPSPAPAVQMLLKDVAVCPIDAKGETVTPTAIALLKANDAVFGPWPSMTIRKTALVYGDKVFDGIPNGAMFAYDSGK